VFLGSINVREAIAASTCNTSGDGAASGRTAGIEAETDSAVPVARSDETTTALGGLIAGFGGVAISPTGMLPRASSRGGGEAGGVELTVAGPGGFAARRTAGLGDELFEAAARFGSTPVAAGFSTPVRTGFPVLPAGFAAGPASPTATFEAGSGFFSFTALILGSVFFSTGGGEAGFGLVLTTATLFLG